MEKNILIILIDENMSQRDISKNLKISQSTVKYWLKKYELKTNYNKLKIIHTHCVLCGKEINQYSNANRSRCGSCNTRIRRYRTKKRAVEYLGGECMCCGWKGNLAAFEFHHKNKDKEFQIGSANNKSWDVVKVELNKCDLLCSNCHRIEHSKYNKDIEFMNAVKNYKGREML